MLDPLVFNSCFKYKTCCLFQNILIDFPFYNKDIPKSTFPKAFNEFFQLILVYLFRKIEMLGLTNLTLSHIFHKITWFYFFELHIKQDMS